ncbi:hypothetical protein [Acidovorax sp. 56]|uniref:hypothetical protein n=1 Tax=Acidovorax sp. 56 TaxID=2035205 RepID=UPI00117786C9|nr:hypothetical protein [Acidovorax sp. 56]
MTPRESLVSAVESRLIPRLTEDGFAQHPLVGVERKSAEIMMAFPFGRFKRRHSENLEIVEIQFDKNGAAKFVLNVGVAPPEGVNLPWAKLSQNDVEVAALPNAFRLYRKASSSEWFSPSWLPTEINGRTARVVEEVVANYSEIDAWFSTGVIGDHMRKFGIPIPVSTP